MPSKTLLALSGLVLAACASSAGSEAAGPAPSPEPAEEAATEAEPAGSEAVSGAAGAATFTDGQADSGRDLFRARCTECHYSSEFSESRFQFEWSRRSAGNLYQLIQTSMPETAPGTLSPEETVALVTYILRMNGFEPGATELAADRAVLDAISLASIHNDTRARHYGSTVSRNFISDIPPDFDDMWLADGGQAESFKQGQVPGEYIAGRIFGTENDEELNESFRLLEATFEEGEEDLDFDE